jgi:hypothetical protein
MKLYHYTCRDMARRILADGVIRPWPIMPDEGPRGEAIPTGLPDDTAVVWLTTIDRPDRQALGLTSHVLNCDRTEVRFTVDVPATRWEDFAAFANPRWRRRKEKRRRPWTWWVYAAPIASFDREERR